MLHYVPRGAPEVTSPAAGDSSAASVATPLRLTPFTSNPGIESQPAFSPDGTRLAYVWNGNEGGNWDIYVKLIGAGEPLRLTTNAAADGSPVWQPRDGKWIAFARYDANTGQGGIYLVPALGGQERRLATQNLPVRESSGPLFQISCSLAWHPDGDTLLFPWRESDTDPVGIFALSVEAGGKPRRVTEPPPDMRSDLLPAFSPDGHTLAFIRNNSHLFLMSFQDGEPRRVTVETARIRGLAWTEDGRDLMFSTTRNGIGGLWRIPATGGEPTPLPVGDDTDVAVAPAGQHRLAFVQNRQGDGQLWHSERPLSAVQRPTATQLIFSSGSDASRPIFARRPTHHLL